MAVPAYSRARLLAPVAITVDQPPDSTTPASAAMNLAAAAGQIHWACNPVTYDQPDAVAVPRSDQARDDHCTRELT